MKGSTVFYTYICVIIILMIQNAAGNKYIKVESSKRVYRRVESYTDSVTECISVCKEDSTTCIGFIQGDGDKTCHLVEDVDEGGTQRDTWLLGKRYMVPLALTLPLIVKITQNFHMKTSYLG